LLQAQSANNEGPESGAFLLEQRTQLHAFGAPSQPITLLRTFDLPQHTLKINNHG
jgi:hypothetical protein